MIINRAIVLGNIKEAREELEALEKRLTSDQNMNEDDLELSIRHAYHHINFAWNIRGKTSEEYAQLTDDDFNKWGSFPDGFDALATKD